MSVNWEYAGFVYVIERDVSGRLTATPEPGQHHFANKEKHRRAAVETFKQENPAYEQSDTKVDRLMTEYRREWPK